MQSIDLILLLNVRIALQNEQTGCISVADRTELSSLGHGMIWHAPSCAQGREMRHPGLQMGRLLGGAEHHAEASVV